MNKPASGSSLTRILMIVIPVAIVLVGIVGFVRFGEDLGLTGASVPKIVPVTGKVTMRGKPLTAGTIQTLYVKKPELIGGIGVIKEDGTFTLETFVEGVPQDGTFVGEHKIVVYNQLPSAGAAAGPLTTPFAYSTGDTTPLKMVIEKDKPLEIVLEVDDDTMTEEEIAKYLTDLEANQSSATQAGMAAPRDPLANQNNGGEGETGDGGDDSDGSEENEEDGGSN